MSAISLSPQQTAADTQFSFDTTATSTISLARLLLAIKSHTYHLFSTMQNAPGFDYQSSHLHHEAFGLLRQIFTGQTPILMPTNSVKPLRAKDSG